jgi:hypothetical protein
MKWLKLFLLIICLSVSGPLFAQFDSVMSNFQREFDRFKTGIEMKHRRFKDKSDSVFANSLKDSWEIFHAGYSKKADTTLKPVAQPSFSPKPDLPSYQNEIHPEKGVDDPVRSDSGAVQYIMMENEMQILEDFGRIEVFDFYGQKPSVITPPKLPEIISPINSKQIDSFFEQVAKFEQLPVLVQQLQRIKNDLILNDWAYLQLVRTASARISPNPEECDLLSWIILIKSGFNVKVGFNKNTIFLLFPSKQKIFGRYFLIGDIPYYIAGNFPDDLPFPPLTIHKADYERNGLLSMKISNSPSLGENFKGRSLSFRKHIMNIQQEINRIDFYGNYPVCDLEVYFSAPLSVELQDSLNHFFKPILSTLDIKQKVSVLLEFAQKAFEYKTDYEQFKKEKYFFSDEVFYYPYSDCEDRAVLFSKLISLFTDLDCIGLNYPGHVNTAVAFPFEMEGDFVTYKSKKYFVCDPTYINAPIGLLPEKFRGMNPKIVLID